MNRISDRTIELSAWILFAVVMVVGFVCGLAGCAGNKVQGGTHEVSHKTSMSTGGGTSNQYSFDSISHGPKSAVDTWDTAVRIGADGAVQINRTHNGATTQGSSDEVHHRSAASTQNANLSSDTALDATTQPSVSSDGLFTLDGDKVTIKANKIAARFAAVWWQSLAMIAVGGFLIWRGRYMVGVLIVIAGLAVAAYPETALAGVIISGICTIWHFRQAFIGIDTATKHGIETTTASGVITPEQAQSITDAAAEKADNWLQRLSKLFP